MRSSSRPRRTSSRRAASARRERLLELGERRTVPERQRVGEQARGASRVSCGQRGAALPTKRLDPIEVELARGYAGTHTPCRGSASRSSGSVFRSLETYTWRALTAVAGTRSPHRSSTSCVTGTRAVRVQEQIGQQRALLARGDLDSAVVTEHLERAEHAELHGL